MKLTTILQNVCIWAGKEQERDGFYCGKCKGDVRCPYLFEKQVYIIVADLERGRGRYVAKVEEKLK